MCVYLSECANSAKSIAPGQEALLMVTTNLTGVAMTKPKSKTQCEVEGCVVMATPGNNGRARDRKRDRGEIERKD